MVQLLSMTHIFCADTAACNSEISVNTLYRIFLTQIYLYKQSHLSLTYKSSLLLRFYHAGAGKRPKRPHTVDRPITARATKKLKSTQTCVSEWGSLLPPESENQAPQRPSESILLSIVNCNLGFHYSFRIQLQEKGILIAKLLQIRLSHQNTEQLHYLLSHNLHLLFT